MASDFEIFVRISKVKRSINRFSATATIARLTGSINMLKSLGLTLMERASTFANLQKCMRCCFRTSADWRRFSAWSLIGTGRWFCRAVAEASVDRKDVAGDETGGRRR